MKRKALVIGAGYGGLSIAGLLQASGYEVTLLEAHSLIGGCASYFKRKGFLFDVGATTFSGVLPSQPVGLLFKKLSLEPKFLKLDPGMIIYLDDKEISRFSNLDTWIEVCEKEFRSKGQRPFWEKIYQINQSAWDFIQSNPDFPPRNFLDYLSLVNLENIQRISLIPHLFRTTSKLCKSLSIENPQFFRFLEEQLYITTQSGTDSAPLLTSAMGLAYPSETYYPIGGMVQPGKEILNNFIDRGGIFSNNQEVLSIQTSTKGYQVKTKKGNTFEAELLIANLPIWNLEKLTDGKISKYFHKLSNRFPKGPGAFVLNFGVRTKVDPPTCYFQIHSRNPLPFASAKAFFVSLSHPLDEQRAPKGFQAVTISIHTHPEDWLGLAQNVYEERKTLLSNAILNEFHFRMHKYLDIEYISLVSGSPKTYSDYTLRQNGFVGGIAHKLYPSLLQLPNGKTPFNGFYQVGDTVFPGQGTPAVVYGALSIFHDISKRYPV
jgi:C-3',4' desaturase CrtD